MRDGHRVVLSTGRGLELRDRDDGSVERVWRAPRGRSILTSWSRDGSFVLRHESENNNPTSVLVYDLEGRFLWSDETVALAWGGDGDPQLARSRWSVLLLTAGGSGSSSPRSAARTRSS